MNIDIGYLKLSMQRALLGNISPKLRAVCLNCVSTNIQIVFYYDGGISSLEKELFESVIDQMSSDLPLKIDGQEVVFLVESQRVDYPNPMPLFGHWVYYRYESSDASDQGTEH